jgi:hypothetical protein
LDFKFFKMINRNFFVVIFTGFLVSNLGYLQAADPHPVEEMGGQYTYRVIQTPVPFLNINPDSRGGAMGDMGVATKPDVNSIIWNSAKYAFIENNTGISLSYSPWLKNIAPDIKLLYLAYYRRLDKQQTIAGGIRFFSLGEMIFTDDNSYETGRKNPSEFTIDVAYSRLFSDKFSGGIVFRYIRSDLSVGAQTTNPNDVSKAGVSWAADLGLYYKTPVQISDMASELTFGMNITNMGSKISYTESAVKDFIPTSLRVGSTLTMAIDPYNKFMVGFDLSKLLVPTPPIVDSGKIVKGMDPNVSVAQGMIQSFYDAPGGIEEELKEIMESVGAEYWYRDQFALRGGYFNESAIKGNRKYFTLGFGVKFNILAFDFSYIVPTAGRTSPLANTMRLTLNFEFGKAKKQQQNQK